MVALRRSRQSQQSVAQPQAAQRSEGTEGLLGNSALCELALEGMGPAVDGGLLEAAEQESRLTEDDVALARQPEWAGDLEQCEVDASEDDKEGTNFTASGWTPGMPASLIQLMDDYAARMGGVAAEWKSVRDDLGAESAGTYDRIHTELEHLRTEFETKWLLEAQAQAEHISLGMRFDFDRYLEARRYMGALLDQHQIGTMLVEMDSLYNSLGWYTRMISDTGEQRTGMHRYDLTWTSVGFDALLGARFAVFTVSYDGPAGSWKVPVRAGLGRANTTSGATLETSMGDVNTGSCELMSYVDHTELAGMVSVVGIEAGASGGYGVANSGYGVGTLKIGPLHFDVGGQSASLGTPGLPFDFSAGFELGLGHAGEAYDVEGLPELDSVPDSLHGIDPKTVRPTGEGMVDVAKVHFPTGGRELDADDKATLKALAATMESQMGLGTEADVHVVGWATDRYASAGAVYDRLARGSVGVDVEEKRDTLNMDLAAERSEVAWQELKASLPNTFWSRLSPRQDWAIYKEDAACPGNDKAHRSAEIRVTYRPF